MTKELLTCATPEAIVYIKKSVNSKSKTDYDKLKKLFDEKKFEASNFEDTELDIRMFNWQSLERDRNWWWQLQALPFLNWYANSFTIPRREDSLLLLLLGCHPMLDQQCKAEHGISARVARPRRRVPCA